MLDIIIIALSFFTLGITVFASRRTNILKRNIKNKSNSNIEKVNKIINQITLESDIENTSNTSIDNFELNLECAINLFLPLLKKLSDNIGKPIFLAEYFGYHKFSNWVIFSLSADLEYKTALSVFSKKKEKNIFTFYILLGNKLFENGKLTVMGKIAITHEFCHLVSVLMSFSSSKNERIITEKLQERLTESLNSLQNEDFVKLYTLLSNEHLSSNKNDNVYFNDSHFRLGLENVQFNYNDLYLGLLLPNTELKKYLNHEKIAHLEKEGRMNEVMLLVSSGIEALVNDTHLPRGLIISRVLHFIPYAFKK